MHPLRTLPNSQLLDATFRLASEERRISLEVLEHFREIERRKAYADLGYRSLFEYAVTHLRYSEGSASRRIAAMHALKEMPVLAEKIQAGETTVTSVAMIHTALRREEKLTATRMDRQEKERIFQRMSALPTKVLERELTVVAPLGSVQERTRPVSEDLNEVKIYLTTEELAALEELKGWMAHSLKVPGSNSELVRKLVQLGREQYLKRNGLRGKKLGAETEAETEAEAEAEVRQRDASPLMGSTLADKCSIAKDAAQLSARQARRAAFTRADFSCEHVNRFEKRCRSRYFIQSEHKTPRALGGKDELSNLEVLCRDHNIIRGIAVFGLKKMRRR